MSLRVNQLCTYPIKGLQGVHTDEVMLDEKGFVHDRQFMLVDENGIFISQRTFPEFVKFKVTLSADTISVSYNNSSIDFRISGNTENIVNVSIWDHENLLSYEVDAAVSDWFSQQLGIQCKLVCESSATRRIKTYNDTYKTGIRFSDGYPILVLGTASVDLLSHKMESEILPNRFRANLIVETQTPHEEDEWLKIKIGDVILRKANQCKRCVVPTIDQHTGLKNPEINRRLAKYRLINGHIMFGMNYVVEKEGIIQRDTPIKTQ